MSGSIFKYPTKQYDNNNYGALVYETISIFGENLLARLVSPVVSILRNLFGAALWQRSGDARD